MAFTTREKEIIRFGIENQKSKEEVKRALARDRLGIAPPQTAPQENVEDTSYLQNVGNFATQSLSSAKEGIEELINPPTIEPIQSETTGQSLLEGTAKVAQAGSRAVGSLGKIVGGVSGAIASPILSPITQFIGDKIPDNVKESFYSFMQDNPEVAKEIENVANISGVASPQIGASIAKATSGGIKSALDTGAEITKPIRPKQLKGLMTNARMKLSDIDPQVSTVLKTSSFDDVNRVFISAKNAKVDAKKATPLDIAGAMAEDAFDKIEKANIKAIGGKKKILEKMGATKVEPETMKAVFVEGIKSISDRFGIQISPNGKIGSIKGRASTLDAQDTKLLQQYFSRLRLLRLSPTLREVDDFVDFAQSKLYKQSKTLSKLEVASEPVIRELRKMTGNLNNHLKTQVGDGYGEVNARIARLIELQDELSGALGADARKGAGLMKRLFSPTGGSTRKLFAEIYKETGIDLVKEATLAKFAMETIGDVRQKTLLQNLNLAVKSGAELDLTKPMSIVKWLQNRANLDGQQLANEILKRTNAPNQ